MGKEAAVYPIGLVEKLTGLSGRRIRYYESCGLLAPARTEGKHRLYTQGEVDRLNQIRSLLEQGMSLVGIRAKLEGEEVSPDNLLQSVQEPTPLVEKWEREMRLTSIYPVSDQAELERMIEEREAEQ